MLSHCANSKCRKPFLRLREGRLFLVETGRIQKPGEAAPPFVRARKKARIVEHFWLCDDCASCWTLAYDNERGLVLMPLPTTEANVRAAATESGIA